MYLCIVDYYHGYTVTAAIPIQLTYYRKPIIRIYLFVVIISIFCVCYELYVQQCDNLQDTLSYQPTCVCWRFLPRDGVVLLCPVVVAAAVDNSTPVPPGGEMELPLASVCCFGSEVGVRGGEALPMATVFSLCSGLALAGTPGTPLDGGFWLPCWAELLPFFPSFDLPPWAPDFLLDGVSLVNVGVSAALLESGCCCPFWPEACPLNCCCCCWLLDRYWPLVGRLPVGNSIL